MATNASPNTFSLIGIVAVDADTKSFNNSAVARFPISVSRREAKGEETIRKSALINCECWAKDASSKRFALLKKGQLVVINGYIKPEEWQTAQGEKRSRITFVCTSIASPTESLGSAKNPTTDKASAKATEPVTVAEPVTDEVPF